MINLRPRQLCFDGFVTIGPQRKSQNGKNVRQKISKKLKIWFFQKISIFCLLVTSKMICFHNLEVPRLDLGHFSGKIFDDVFEIFGRGPKSHFWSKNAKNEKNCQKFFHHHFSTDWTIPTSTKTCPKATKMMKISKFSLLEN